MRYRRDRCPGGTWFFTVNLQHRGDDLLVRHIDALRAVMRRVRRDHPFAIEAMVVLPDHLHAIWRLPPGDAAYPTRWRLIKAGFTRALARHGIAGRRPGGAPGRAVWQRRYWEHRIRDDTDLARHVAYIHYNPVKHGHVAHPADWPHSTIHRDIRAGLLPPDWAAGADIPAGELGERGPDDAPRRPRSP